jgi:putative DNA primase/helicase
MMPKSSEEAVQLLEDLTSRVGAFVRERCLVQDSARVDCADLYSAWCEWCEENGHNHPGTKQSFGKELGAYLPSVRTRTGSTERFYDGISLKATFREATFDDFGDDGLLPLPAIEGQIDRN